MTNSYVYQVINEKEKIRENEQKPLILIYIMTTTQKEKRKYILSGFENIIIRVLVL